MSGSAGALTNGLMKCRIMPQVAMLDGDGRLGVNSASREVVLGSKVAVLTYAGGRGSTFAATAAAAEAGLTGQMSQRIAMAPQQPGRLK